jgi:hypothetical protein
VTSVGRQKIIAEKVTEFMLRTAQLLKGENRMSTSFRCLSVGVLAIAISIAGAARGQDLMITGVLDGTLSLNGGGSPKVIELYAINAIPNLSLYALSRAPNGNPTFDVFAAENVLPNIALNAGDFYYAVGNSFQSMLEAFDAVFPEKSAKRVWNYGVNSNGDDATALFFNATGEFVGNDANATLIDVVGNPGEDGTGTPWDHIDSWLYSKDGRAPSATFNVSNWNVGGIDILDLKRKLQRRFPTRRLSSGADRPSAQPTSTRMGSSTPTTWRPGRRLTARPTRATPTTTGSPTAPTS